MRPRKTYGRWGVTISVLSWVSLTATLYVVLPRVWVRADGWALIATILLLAGFVWWVRDDLKRWPR